MEILKIHRQIRLLEETEQQGPHVHRIDLAELDAAIPQFSGDDHYDIIKWFAQFENYTDIYKYTDKEKCVGIRRRLKGTARRYVNNLGLLEYSNLKANLI